jgi:hypothetical protein
VKLRGVACEKPLARNVAEAKRLVQLAKQSNLLTGYLENQVFAPAVVTVIKRTFFSLNKRSNGTDSRGTHRERKLFGHEQFL